MDKKFTDLSKEERIQIWSEIEGKIRLVLNLTGASIDVSYNPGAVILDTYPWFSTYWGRQHKQRREK